MKKILILVLFVSHLSYSQNLTKERYKEIKTSFRSSAKEYGMRHLIFRPIYRENYILVTSTYWKKIEFGSSGSKIYLGLYFIIYPDGAVTKPIITYNYVSENWLFIESMRFSYKTKNIKKKKTNSSVMSCSEYDSNVFIHTQMDVAKTASSGGISAQRVVLVREKGIIDISNEFLNYLTEWSMSQKTRILKMRANGSRGYISLWLHNKKKTKRKVNSIIWAYNQAPFHTKNNKLK